MRAEATAPLSLLAAAHGTGVVFTEAANGEDAQAVGAGAAGPLAPFAEHGDGQNAHTVCGRAA